MVTIGSRILRARNAKGLMATTLAATLGVRPHTVWRWEAGHMSPRAGLVSRIASALDVDAGWLLTGSGRGPRRATKAA